MIIISFIRLYRLMDYMAPIDLSTVTTPLSRDVIKVVRSMDVEISTL